MRCSSKKGRISQTIHISRHLFLEYKETIMSKTRIEKFHGSFARDVEQQRIEEKLDHVLTEVKKLQKYSHR